MSLPDRIIVTTSACGLLVFAGLGLFEAGKEHQAQMAEKCEVRTVRAMYSTEELERMVRARRRMERVK